MTHEVLPDIPIKYSYAKGAGVLVDVAKAFDIPADEKLEHEWRTIFRGIYELDHILDSNRPEVERHEQFDTLVSDICSIESPAPPESCRPNCSACELKSAALEWPEHRRLALFSDAMQIKEIGRMMRQTRSARHLGKLSLVEGKITSQLFFLDTESKESREAEFNRWLTNLGGLGNVTDTVLDLSEDYESNLIKVKPTRTNQFIIASVATAAAARVSGTVAVKPKVARTFYSSFLSWRTAKRRNRQLDELQ